MQTKLGKSEKSENDFNLRTAYGLPVVSSELLRETSENRQSIADWFCDTDINVKKVPICYFKV